MNLYLIQRSPNCYVEDAFAYAIVAAETGKEARHIHPTRGVTWSKTMWMKGGRDYGFAIWTDPRHVRSRLIGTAVAGTAAGMVCTSFNQLCNRWLCEHDVCREELVHFRQNRRSQ